MKKTLFSVLSLMAFSPLLWAQETEMITQPQSQYKKALEL